MEYLELIAPFRALVEAHPDWNLNIQDWLHLLARQEEGKPVNPLRFKDERKRAESTLMEALNDDLHEIAHRIWWRKNSRHTPRLWAEQQIADGCVKLTTIPAPSEPSAEETDDDLRALRAEVDLAAQDTPVADRLALLNAELVETIGHELSAEFAHRIMSMFGFVISICGSEHKIASARENTNVVWEGRVSEMQAKHELEKKLLTHESAQPRSPNGAGGPQQYRQPRG